MPEGAERRYCALIRDVTERRELQKQQRLRFESETLLKEIHHRVKNNMQVISSLLSIQSSQLKDAAQRDVFLECRERIRAMSLIHDRLYSTGQYAAIDFGDYLREMIALITSSNRPAGAEVRVDLQAEPVQVEVEKAVPLSLIASELVLNSLKHAFHGRPEGTLTVRLTRENGTCRLFVGDDGPGMQPRDPDRGGVGLQLIDGLTKQIKARREVSPGPGVGTTIVWNQ
jgi:two-component sensor histidine kinase